MRVFNSKQSFQIIRYGFCLACILFLLVGCNGVAHYTGSRDQAYEEFDDAEQWEVFLNSPSNRVITEYISLEDEFDYLAWHTRHLSATYGINISVDDINFTEVRLFSWLDFITPEQFVIVREYLRENLDVVNFTDVIYDNFVFADGMIINYVMNNLVYFPHTEFGDDLWFEMRRNPQDFNPYYLLRYYDSIPIEDMSYCPRRIIVRMYEAYYIAIFEIRDRYAHLHNLPMQSNRARVGSLGRDVFDWRE